jgi:hypothetical protein
MLAKTFHIKNRGRTPSKPRIGKRSVTNQLLIQLSEQHRRFLEQLIGKEREHPRAVEPYRRKKHRDPTNGSWTRRNREFCSTHHALGINIEPHIFFMPLRRVWIDKGKGRNEWRPGLAYAARFCATFALAICFAGCEEHSQQLEERVTQLQKELNRTQDELRSTKRALDATNGELTRLKAAAQSAPVTGPTSSGVAEAKPAASIPENQSAPAQRPTTSSLPADRSVMIQWPGSSGASAPANQNAPAPVGGNAPAASAQQSGASGSGGASNRAVVIQWPNNNSAPPSTNQAPPGAANPPARSVQQPAPNSATGRSDRSVIIQWPDGGQSPGPRN